VPVGDVMAVRQTHQGDNRCCDRGSAQPCRTMTSVSWLRGVALVSTLLVACLRRTAQNGPAHTRATRHWGVAALHPQGLASTHLVLTTMVRAASAPGKTFDRNAPAWPKGRSVIAFFRPGVKDAAALPRLHQRRRVG
jgi:hypothetical protein